MPRRQRIVFFLVMIAAAGGCEARRRYPLATSTATTTPSEVVTNSKPRPLPTQYGWLEPVPRIDIAIHFIAEDTNPREWQALKHYWNESTTPAGLRTAALGLPPLEAAVAMRTQLHVETIKIKVPRGLPDPTPFIPAANPPTLGQWLLGKRLFFDDTLLKLTVTVTTSCANCHVPAEAFTLNKPIPSQSNRNVPSLLNSVYNRHQFWDGRAEALEQVLLRQLEDERDLAENPPPEQSPGHLHIWPGLVNRVRDRADLEHAFQLVYGKYATADSIAKSLASFMRTLLSGNSLVDQALQHRKQRGSTMLEPEDFEPYLSADVLKQLPTSLPTKEAAKDLTRGHDLFHGRARCNVCHNGPLFTDHGFHNVGVGALGENPDTGRFAVLPYGLKDVRMIGAFKTPSLRNVSRTAPYMHDGSFPTLFEVLGYFNEGLRAEWNRHLDDQLLEPFPDTEGPHARHLYLSPQDLAALELYLRALRGEELPAWLAGPAAR